MSDGRPLSQGVCPSLPVGFGQATRPCAARTLLFKLIKGIAKAEKRGTDTGIIRTAPTLYTIPDVFHQFKGHSLFKCKKPRGRLF